MFIKYNAQIRNLSLGGDSNILNVNIRTSRTIFSEVRVNMYDLCFAIVEHLFIFKSPSSDVLHTFLKLIDRRVRTSGFTKRYNCVISIDRNINAMCFENILQWSNI